MTYVMRMPLIIFTPHIYTTVAADFPLKVGQTYFLAENSRNGFLVAKPLVAF
jgi:hypothetical protein